MATIPTSSTIISRIAEAYHNPDVGDDSGPNVLYIGDEQYRQLLIETSKFALLNADQIAEIDTKEEIEGGLQVSGLEVVRVRRKNHFHVAYSSWFAPNYDKWLSQ